MKTYTYTELKINKEFLRLIPPLSKVEYNLLEESLIKEGCRDKIITWKGVIVDGHNRYEICTKNNIPFLTTEKDFANEDEVKLWMIDNQAGRRNLSDWWKYELESTKEEILKAKGKAKIIEAQKKRHNASEVTLSNNDKDIPNHNTQKEIAKDLGWSTGKVAQAKIVKEKAPEELKEKLRNDEISIHKAYKEVKAAEPKAAKPKPTIANIGEKSPSFDEAKADLWIGRIAMEFPKEGIKYIIDNLQGLY